MMVVVLFAEFTAPFALLVNELYFSASLTLKSMNANNDNKETKTMTTNTTTFTSEFLNCSAEQCAATIRR